MTRSIPKIVTPLPGPKAQEHFGIVPDVVTLGKAIAGGIPLSIAAARKEVMDLPPGAHCTTTGGNPIATAAAQVFLDILFEEQLMERATELGDHVLRRLRAMQQEHEIVGDVRGKGLAICFELVKDRRTKEPLNGKDIVGRLFRKGVVAVTGGSGVRIFPPLTIEQEMLDTSLDILESTIVELEHEWRSVSRHA